MADGKEQKAGKGGAGQPGPAPGNEAGVGGTGGAAGGGVAGGAEPPKTPAPGSTTPVAVAARTPCCCDKVLVYLQKVECLHVTAALGLITFTSDEIAITSLVQQDGGGPTGAKWPDNRTTYPLDNGESTDDELGFLLATLTPNHRCKVSAEVAITLWKFNVFDDIRPVLEDVLGKAAVIGQSMSAVPSLGDAMKGLLDRLYKAAGIGKTPVGDPIRLHFHFDLPCDTALKDLFEPGMGRNVVADGTDACGLTRTVAGEKGKYRISLRFVRECDDRKPY